MAQVDQDPAFLLYAKDFLSSEKVRLMSMTERGVYITLLLHEWIEGSIPADLNLVARMVMTNPKQLERMWQGGPLHQCFVPGAEGRLVNPRMEYERSQRQLFKAKQSENGRKGGRPRKPNSYPPESQNNPPLSVGFVDAKPKESLSSSSSSSSASASASTPPIQNIGGVPRATPLIARRRLDAAWEGPRVYVPNRVHSDFIGYRNHPNAEQELLAWYERISDEWTTGARQHDPAFDPDMVRFWKARYAEEWPSVKVDPKRPAWAR